MTTPQPSTTSLWEGRTGPFPLLLGERTFPPTKTSKEVADALEVEPGDTVIDVGCGCGVLSFVAARLGAARVHATEINEEAVAFARLNATELGLADRVEVHHGSLLEPLEGVRADVVIGDVAGIPDAVAAVTGWFPGGFSGGTTGAEVPVAMLESLGPHLRPGGRLYLPTGSIQDERRILDAAARLFGADGLRQVRERLLPLPSDLLDDPAVEELVASGKVDVIRRRKRLFWELRVWECRLPRA